jgi:nucleoside-diphosphate-sugar epimerase
MSTVLVTGVSGKVGWFLARRTAEGGFTVRALVRTDEQARYAGQQGWRAVRGDLTDFESLSRALEGVDFVVHSAAQLGDSGSLFQSVNVDGTRELAERALQAGIRRFVHISTVAVYGDPTPPGVEEESALAATDPWPYAATKALAELELAKVRSRGLPIAILRPGMITHWVRSYWGNEMVEHIRSKGWPDFLLPDDVLPWVHNENLAEMTWLCLTHPSVPNEAFNAVDRNVTIKDFYGPVAMALGKPIAGPDRAPVNNAVRLGKIGAKLGYRARFTFEETVSRLVELAKHPGNAP